MRRWNEETTGREKRASRREIKEWRGEVNGAVNERKRMEERFTR